MTKRLFLEDSYLRETGATVTAHTDEGGIVLDATIFYPTGGGQPGDSGVLNWDQSSIEIATTVKAADNTIALVPAEPTRLPAIGTVLTQHLHWERRYKHMRIHTALHLLSVVIPLPVTGGAINAEKGRLDFDMPTAPANKDVLTETLNRLIACDFAITEEWISEAELNAQPSLVKTMSVSPPRGAGKIRLIRIGQGENTADLQPCGGTHVATTSEVGRVKIGKIEKKGKQNRRVQLLLD